MLNPFKRDKEESIPTTFALPTNWGTLSQALDSNSDKLPTDISRLQAAKMAYGIQLSCAYAISESLMGIDYFVERLVEESYEHQPNHRIEAILNSPNRFNTGEELRFIIGMDLFFLGESFLYIKLDGLHNPSELYPMYGQVGVHKIDDTDKLPTSYKQKIGGTERYYAAEEIIHIRRPKFQEPFGGASDISPAAGLLSIVGKLQESQWKLYKQGAFPAGFLMVSGSTKAKEREALEKEIKERHSGVGNWMKIIPLNADNVKWVETSRSPKDMLYDRSSKELISEILMLLRVPAAILGKVEGGSRASYEALEYFFARYRLNPLVQLIVSNFDKDLVKRYVGDDYRLVSEPVVPEDKAYELEKTEMWLRNGVILPNEVRAKEGLDPLPDNNDSPVEE